MSIPGFAADSSAYSSCASYVGASGRYTSHGPLVPALPCCSACNSPICVKYVKGHCVKWKFNPACLHGCLPCGANGGGSEDECLQNCAPGDSECIADCIFGPL